MRLGRFCGFCVGSVRFGEAQFPLGKLSAFRGGSARLGAARRGSARLGAARSGSVRARRCSLGRAGAPAELCYHLPGTAGCWAALGPGGLRAVEGNLYPPLGLIPKPERHVGPDPSRGSQAQPATIMGLLPAPLWADFNRTQAPGIKGSGLLMSHKPKSHADTQHAINTFPARPLHPLAAGPPGSRTAAPHGPSTGQRTISEEIQDVMSVFPYFV